MIVVVSVYVFAFAFVFVVVVVYTNLYVLELVEVSVLTMGLLPARLESDSISVVGNIVYALK